MKTLLSLIIGSTLLTSSLHATALDTPINLRSESVISSVHRAAEILDEEDGTHLRAAVSSIRKQQVLIRDLPTQEKEAILRSRIDGRTPRELIIDGYMARLDELRAARLNGLIDAAELDQKEATVRSQLSKYSATQKKG
jgi:hypothetical protein